MRLWLAGAVLGLGLGGFLDGIVLHQLLQWHRLVSGVTRDPGSALFWDGAFHAAMFVLVVAGAAMAWQERRGGTTRSLVGGILLGSGVFHVLDAIVNHWLLGTHRINPHEHTLFWDLMFFALGLVLLAAGVMLVRPRRVAV